MAGVLDVYFHDQLAGQLTEDADGLISFAYEPTFLSREDAMPLSISLPLQKGPFDFRACRGFFSGILPEGEIRTMIARNLGISGRNEFAMLREIGGECAGAVTFLPAGQSLSDQRTAYRQLTTDELEQILIELPRKPLLAGDQGVRLSMAGAQAKIAVFIQDDVVSIPLANAVSTHLIKPDHIQFPGLAYNEAFCMQLAADLGFQVAPVRIRHVGRIPYLLIERYDRTPSLTIPGRWNRIHQEDFCQALGIVSDHKYQREGGPSLAHCFGLLREYSTSPVTEISQLLDAVVFNWLIGNHDAHAKNFSLLYEFADDGEHIIRLAPLYDLACTDMYPNLDKLMSMEIGGKYKSMDITSEHIEAMARVCQLSPALTKRRFVDVADRMISLLEKGAPSDTKQVVFYNHILERGKRLMSELKRE